MLQIPSKLWKTWQHKEWDEKPLDGQTKKRVATLPRLAHVHKTYGHQVAMHFPSCATLYAALAVIGSLGLLLACYSKLSSYLPSRLQHMIQPWHNHLGLPARWIVGSVGATALTLNTLLVLPLLFGPGAATFHAWYSHRSTFSSPVEERLIKISERGSAPSFRQSVFTRISYATCIPLSLLAAIADLAVGACALLLLAATAGKHRGTRKVCATSLVEGTRALCTTPYISLIRILNSQPQPFLVEKEDVEEEDVEEALSWSQRITSSPQMAQLIDFCVLPISLPASLLTAGRVPALNYTALRGLSVPGNIVGACFPKSWRQTNILSNSEEIVTEVAEDVSESEDTHFPLKGGAYHRSAELLQNSGDEMPESCD